MLKLRPFELLKLIRDRRLTNVNQLPTWGGSTPTAQTWSEATREALSSMRECYEISRFIEGLKNAGWVKIGDDGEITMMQPANDMQRALNISLSRLSPYSVDSVISDPLFGFPANPPAPLQIFVLMPFSVELKPVYEDHIIAVASRLGVRTKRADDFFAATTIIEDVWNAIYKADIIIADCTGRNPNVFYELGISHTVGKSTILIAQTKNDIPFDVQQRRAIIYDFNPRGMRKFEDALEATILYEMKQPHKLIDLLPRP